MDDIQPHEKKNTPSKPLPKHLYLVRPSISFSFEIVEDIRIKFRNTQSFVLGVRGAAEQISEIDHIDAQLKAVVLELLEQEILVLDYSETARNAVLRL